MQQVYTAGEVIYDAGEKDCDALYFVMAGKVKVEAKFVIENRHQFPRDSHSWEVNTQIADITYFVKQLEVGGFFGLEELIEIGMHIYNRTDAEAKKVTRKLCVTAVEDTRLLFLPADVFHK